MGSTIRSLSQRQNEGKDFAMVKGPSCEGMRHMGGRGKGPGQMGPLSLSSHEVLRGRRAARWDHFGGDRREAVVTAERGSARRREESCL